jgi:DNA/RNA-binding domain of Phe-tRNA-synthetase-like protein
MEIRYHPDVKEMFPDLMVSILKVEGLKIQSKSAELEGFKKEVIDDIVSSYDLETLKDHEGFRRYRDFFWKIGIDPTKIRPASEALVRRILQGKPLPRINTGVDAYNLASVKSGVPLAAFDAAKVKGELTMRFSNEGERFMGIGMKEAKLLKGGEVIVEDANHIIAIYPYRDADDSKITGDTKDIVLMACGVPGIPWDTVKTAGELAKGYLEGFSGA